jgi:chemotaxis protein CheZ
MEDSEDLEALFDSIVQAGSEEASAPQVQPAAEEKPAEQDSADLEALFDSVSQQKNQEKPAVQTVSEETAPVFAQVGQLTRTLYNALRELGYDKSIEKVVNSVPDANDRLAYIANLTQQAAERVLNSIEVARPIQEKLSDRASALAGEWQKAFDNKLSVDEFKLLAVMTRDYLGDVPGQVKATNTQLTDIMMAQDFQDLTGQVIKKVVDIVRSVESQLIGLLIENMPKKEEVPEGLMNGPVIKADGRVDVVTNQAQVDELLESLGF